MNTIKNTLRRHGGKIVAIGAGVVGFATKAQAAYTDTDAVVTAVNGIPATATTAFLAGAGLGVSVLIVGFVVYALRKGIKPR